MNMRRFCIQSRASLFFFITFAVFAAAERTGALLAASPATLKIFTSEEDQFRVDIPGTPDLEEVSEDGQSSQRQWTLFDSDSVRYAITVQAADLKGAEIDRFLALLRLNKIAEHGESADLRADEKLQLKGGIKALEIEMPLKGDLRDVASVRTRFFVTNGKVYILSVAGRFADIRKAEANRFLDSFEVITRPAAPAPQKSARPGRNRSLQEFVFANDGFSIKLPSKPVESQDEIEGDSGEPFIQKRWTVETEIGTYMIAAQDSTVTHAQNPDAVEKAFDTTAENLAKTFSGEVLSAIDISVSKGIPGREIRVSLSNGGVYRTRVFFGNRRFYQLIAIGTPEFSNNRESSDILKSFRFVNESGKSEVDVGLVDYQTALGGYKARLPFKPVYSRRTQADGNGVERIQHLYMCEKDSSSAVLVSVTEFNGLGQKSSDELDTMIGQLVRGMAGKHELLEFTRVESDVCLGEWTFRHQSETAGDVVRGRILVADDRFFIVQAIGNEEFVSSESTDAIVESLAIVSETSK
jgi:hypothetical protein